MAQKQTATSIDEGDEPVSDEFRRRCHAALDTLLTRHPGTAVVLASAMNLRVEAVSVPPSLAVKKGVIRELYTLVEQFE